ncbi:forkhead box protein P3 [Discoglossus pictus]
MVTAPAPLSTSPHLRALLQEHKQAVVVHPLSRDSTVQSPVIQTSPAASASRLNVQPTRIYPVMTKHKQQHMAQGFSLTSLGWVQHDLPVGKAEGVIPGKKSSASASLDNPPGPDTEKPPKKSPGSGHSRESTGHIYSLLYGGACKFPGCEKTFGDYRQCLSHLYNEHHIDDKRTVQCLIQTELVQNLEEQLVVEKQRLHQMQSQMRGKHHTLTTHLSKQRERSTIFHHSHPGVLPWPALDLSVPLQKELSDTILAVRRQIWEGNGINIFQNTTNCIEYYRTNDVRPPFTYASLIRWAILESPQKQLALNEIYHWFTRMFAYFRYNTATWKNAVRHNLSLHKCFVRVENIKGAVWMVDELEFQRKRGARSAR